MSDARQRIPQMLADGEMLANGETVSVTCPAIAVIDWNVLLAYQLQKSLAQNLSAEDRGVRRARFAVLRTAEMPAVLIEGGFLSDSVEQKKIADPKYRDQLAAAIVQGIENYDKDLRKSPTESYGEPI